MRNNFTIIIKNLLWSKTKVISTVAIIVFSLSCRAIKADDLIYYSADRLPLLGTLAPDATKSYSRLPDSLESKIRPDLWALGKNSAGLAVRFRSNASAIGAEWSSLNKMNMNHMTATGIRGLDLYVLSDDGKWTTVSSARPVFGKKHTRTLVISDMEPKMREYMLYLSLYDGVDSLMIGVDSTAVLLSPAIDLPSREKPIVMYGTSILQGGCATRPGMCHTSILGRMFNREVINLGFSGNAKLDPEIAQLIASCPDPGLIVIDPLPNVKTPELKERLIPFYEIIRKSHPTVPILFVESPLFPLTRFNTETFSTITEKNDALKELYNLILERGDSNTAYFKGEDVLGDCYEGTVDNYHLTDMGFKRFADNLAPVIERLIGTGIHQD